MRLLSWSTCFLLLFLTSACLDIIEEITLQADGSGTYALIMDMSGMMDDGFMGEAMRESMREETGQDKVELDSIIDIAALNDGLPATLTADDRAILDRTTVHLQLSESKGVAQLLFEFPFDKVQDITAFQATLNKMSQASQAASENGGGAGLMGASGAMPQSNSTWNFTGKLLERTAIDSPTSLAEMFEEEELGFVKMFMENSQFSTVYHLPGKVKKCTIPNEVKEGNTVTITYELLDMLQQYPETSGTIKFKKH